MIVEIAGAAGLYVGAVHAVDKVVGKFSRKRPEHPGLARAKKVIEESRERSANRRLARERTLYRR